MVKSSRLVFSGALLSLFAAAVVFSGLGSEIVVAADRLVNLYSNDASQSDVEAPMNTVSLTDFSTAATENFNSLPSTGTELNANTLPTGWSFVKSDDGNTFSSSNGTLNTPNVYSYGATSDSERALGSLDTTVISTFGVEVENKTGSTAKGFSISYTGEQWRRGSSGTADKLIFEYCVGCSSVGTGTWTAVTALDFTAPFQSTNPGQINKEQNGNATNRQTAVSGTVTVTVNNNGNIRFRWRGTNVADNDDGLAIDNFSVRAIPTVPETSITANPASLTNSTSASFSFSSNDPGATFECSIDGGAYATCTSPRSYTGLSEGSHTFNVRATSSTGTDETPSSYTWTVDSVAPTASFVSAPSGWSNTTSPTISFSATDSASGVERIECSLNNATFATCTSPVALTGLSQGSQSFRIRAVDNAGNTSSIATASWSVDSIAPSVTNVTALTNTTSTTSRTTDITVTDANTLTSITVNVAVATPIVAVVEGGPIETTTSFSSSSCPVQNESQNRYRCTIPGASAGSVVSYYVAATDQAVNETRVPSFGSFSYVVQNSSGQTDLPGGTYGTLTLDSSFNISGDITVTNGLSLTGSIQASSNLVTFGCDATVSGTGFIIGAVNKQFCASGSFTYPIGVDDAPVASNGGIDGSQGGTPVFAPATITIISVNGPSSLTVDAFVGQLTGVAPTHFTGIYWSTRETGDLTADLRFGWDVSSEVGSSGLYTPIRRSSTTEVVPGTVNTLGRFVDFPAISVFDGSGSPLVDGPSGITVPYYWTAALIGTSAGRNELSGKVTSAEGLPLRGVSVTLIGGDLSEPMTVRTNQFGVYKFAGLEAGSTYVVNVNSGRHTFSNNSRIVYLADNLSSENFVADRR